MDLDLPSPDSSVGRVKNLYNKAAGSIPSLSNIFPRNSDSHCENDSLLSVTEPINVLLIIPPQTKLGGYTGVTLSVRHLSV